MEAAQDPNGWYLDFGQSARWYAKGERVLLFRQKQRNRQGEAALAFRAPPWTLQLPGPVVGVLGAPYGWRDHPAGKDAQTHYPIAEGSA